MKKFDSLAELEKEVGGCMVSIAQVQLNEVRFIGYDIKGIYEQETLDKAAKESSAFYLLDVIGVQGIEPAFQDARDCGHDSFLVFAFFVENGF